MSKLIIITLLLPCQNTSNEIYMKSRIRKVLIFPQKSSLIISQMSFHVAFRIHVICELIVSALLAHIWDYYYLVEQKAPFLANDSETRRQF